MKSFTVFMISYIVCYMLYVILSAIKAHKDNKITIKSVLLCQNILFITMKRRQ